MKQNHLRKQPLSPTQSRRSPSIICIGVCAGIVAGTAVLGGCVRRTITINSQPEGALVWLNDREIGRTPVSVDFVHYGRYDVVLVKEGYEPLITTGDAAAPLWDTPPLDLGAELLPVPIHNNLIWSYELQPADMGTAGVIERGRAIRAQLIGAADAAADIDPEGDRPANGDAEPVSDSGPDQN